MDTTQWALVVAALGVLVSPFTSWLTFLWSRSTERERWDREREADAARWDRDERRRRLLRGEDAAKEVLIAVDQAKLILEHGSRKGEGETLQNRLEPVYHHIRQQADLLTDDEAQSRIAAIADNLYYYTQAMEAAHPFLSTWSIGHTCSDAAHAILRAYLHGRPLPETPRMARLQRLHDEGGERLAKEFADEFDPLDEPLAEREQ